MLQKLEFRHYLLADVQLNLKMDVFRNSTKLFRFTHADLKAINEPMNTHVSRTGEVLQEWRNLFKQLHLRLLIIFT